MKVLPSVVVFGVSRLRRSTTAEDAESGATLAGALAGAALGVAGGVADGGVVVVQLPTRQASGSTLLRS